MSKPKTQFFLISDTNNKDIMKFKHFISKTKVIKNDEDDNY